MPVGITFNTYCNRKCCTFSVTTVTLHIVWTNFCSSRIRSTPLVITMRLEFVGSFLLNKLLLSMTFLLMTRNKPLTATSWTIHFWNLFVNYVGQMYEVCGLVIEHEIHVHFHKNSATRDYKILYTCRSEKSYLWVNSLVAAWFAVRWQCQDFEAFCLWCDKNRITIYYS
jgi:hypothetical protein